MNERPPAGVDPPVKEPAVPIAAAAEWIDEPTAEPAADPFADFDPLPPRHAGPPGAVARSSPLADSPAEFDPESVDARVFADEPGPDAEDSGNVVAAVGWTVAYIALVNLPLLAFFFFCRPRSPGETALGVAGAMAAGYALGLQLTVRTLTRSCGEKGGGKVGLRPPGLEYTVLAVLLFPGATIAAAWLAQVSTAPDAHRAADAVAMRDLIGGYPVLFVVVIGVVAGVCEELWFRGVLGAALVRRCGPVVGVGVTSVLFGLAHLNPHTVLALTLMGVVLHVVYLTSRSFWIPIGMHVVNNALAVLTIDQTDKIPRLLGVGCVYWTVFLLAAFVVVREKYGSADDPAARQPGVRRRSSPVSWEGGVRVSLSPRAVRLIVKLVLGIAVLLVLFGQM